MQSRRKLRFRLVVSFALFGFDWDYGGNVVDWRGGRLDRLWELPDSSRAVMLRFTTPDAPPAVSGEGTYRSDLPGMRAARAVVSVVSVTPR